MLTVAEGRELGRELRRSVPRTAHAELVLPERDPVGILIEQNATRMPDLVPVRIGRMSQSPFAYYRGTAAVMAHDLSAGCVTGQELLCCGDAHISNFGMYASPERRLLFDLNDFDEASIAPWEWDVKRMATSVVLGGRDRGQDDARNRDAAEAAVRAYRLTLQYLFELSALERFYYQVEAESVEQQVSAKYRKVVQKAIDKARTRTSLQARGKLMTYDEGGSLHFVEDPPMTHHVERPTLDELTALFAQYLTTLRTDAGHLLAQFHVVDFALRAVGVGSVGTRCYVVLLEGPSRMPLFLQVKEAPPSVLETYGHRPPGLPEGVPAPQRGWNGHRVVTGQRILQAQSDPFLGWMAAWDDAENRRPADYYWRQFRDMKGSVDFERLPPTLYEEYGMLCGRLLARAHSQSNGGSVVLGYLGRSDRFDKAVAQWAIAYADQSERDHAALLDAVATRRLPSDRAA